MAPHFYNGNVENIRNAGSDTTFFMMQKVGDLYTGAGLYGCTLNDSAGETLYNSSDPASVTSNEYYFCQSGKNVSTSDTADNWDRTEVTEGVDLVGSGGGQYQLCGATSTPLPVDFSRSSKPAGTACSTMVQNGYAKDGVPILDYPINPSTYGTSTTAPYSNINGGVVGPVALGWLPGDTPSGPYTGSALTSLSNADNGGGASSTIYRLWCATGATQITDWGSLVNLGPNLEVQGVTLSGTTGTISGTFPSTVATNDAISGPGIPSGDKIQSVSGNQITLTNAASSGTVTVRITTSSSLPVGQGMPIGVPMRIMGINTSSGTEATWASMAESGVASGGCSSNMDTDAASDPNPATNSGDNTGQHIALENNSAQIGQFAQGDWPNPDYVDQAIEASTTLYIESNGVYNTNPYAGAVTINGTSYSGAKVSLNGVDPNTPQLLNNSYPTARTLFNIYNSNTVRASTGGYLNWICDGNTNFTKGVDDSTGANFDTELTTIIGSVFGFPRLTDTSTGGTTTPADNLAAPNTSCAATLQVNTTASSNQVTLTGGGNFAASIVNSGQLANGSYHGGSVLVTGTGIPSNTTVVSGAGTGTLTLSNNATATATGVSVLFGGVPSVTSVATSQN